MDANIFYDGLLRRTPGKRVSFKDSLRVYEETFPGDEGGGSNKYKLLKLLEKLVNIEKIRYIKNGIERKLVVDENGREHSMEVPSKIEVLKGEKGPGSARVFSFELHPGFEFASDLKGSNQKKIERIIQYLIENPQPKPLIPLKERSVDVFGDEKELDRLINGSSIVKSNLILERLGCFKVTPPLIHSCQEVETAGIAGTNISGSSQKILILENFSSYWSFESWNKTSHYFYQIVYGAGFLFQQAHEFLEKITAELSDPEFYYLGDLDYSGIIIPNQTNEVRKEWGLPAIKPLLGVYSWLINNGIQAEGVRTTKKEMNKCKLFLNDWFDADIDLALKLFCLIQSGKRIAQENFGYRQLCNLKETSLFDQI